VSSSTEIITNSTSKTFISAEGQQGTRLRSWLIHYAVSQKVAGSIPDEVMEYFSVDLILPVALGSTQPLTEMSTWSIFGCKGLPAGA
jgi:hypothetical protein